MIRMVFLAAVCCTLLCGSSSAVEDPIGEKLASAKKEHQNATEKARGELLANLKEKEEAAQKAGDLKLLVKIQAESIAFAERDTIPNVVSTNVYGNQIRVAKAAMNAAYKESVSQYMKAGKTDIAKAIQTEQNEFNKDLVTPAPAGDGTGVTGMKGRLGAAKIANLKAGGGNPETEAAVVRALIWLDKQQNKAKGSWTYDGTSANDNIAATGMALLPFLAAGLTHKGTKENNKYKETVEKGLTFLVSQQLPAGNFRGSSGTYAHAIATIAICEAYGMTGDKIKLFTPAKRAIEYIIKTQGPDGSWGYAAGANGDTSILGWQIQALYTARLCKDIAVPPQTLAKAMKFLDKVANGAKKSAYGYTDNKTTSPTLSSVGLLCRYYVDGWSPAHPGMTDGVERISKESMPTENRFDSYYCYYATQIMHYYEGDIWHKEWNPKMRDILLKLQNNDKFDGSWDSDNSMTGSACGRLGTTCLATLTLEVYYRHMSHYKRDTEALKKLERAK